VKVLHGTEEIGYLSEVPVDVDLLQVSLRQAKLILLIFLVGTIEKNIVPIGDTLLLYEGTPLVILSKA
jgi:hypothetical protein